MHYSFDYAQQVHFPSNPMQPGPIYFKTPRKCGIFGIMCEAVPRQVNYLIDEAAAIGKGANATISYVHHFLSHYGLGETDVHLHADNCAGQNKNTLKSKYSEKIFLSPQREGSRLGLRKIFFRVFRLENASPLFTLYPSHNRLIKIKTITSYGI